MKNSKFILDKFAKLFEQGLISSKDLKNELISLLNSKRDEIIFKMKISSKEEFEVLLKRVEKLEKRIEILNSQKQKKTKRVKRS